MLDDLKMIHERDAQDALGGAEKAWQQLSVETTFEPAFVPSNDILNVVYCGLGNSALAALLSQSVVGLHVPFEVVREYDIPLYVGEKSLFIAASDSGNTEETLEAIGKAEAQGAQIGVMAGGGTLVDIAHQKGYPLMIMPKSNTSSHGVFNTLKALVTLLDQASLTTISTSELVQSAEFLRVKAQDWLPTVPTASNLAKQIAQECMGKSIVVYSGPKLAAAAYAWKTGFNRNAKQLAWCGQYPEFNHNEFAGWSKQPVNKPYAVIDIRSSFEHERVCRRFEVSERLLSGMRPKPIIVQAEGDTLLEQLLWVINFGDFVTLYTALLNGLNPANADLEEKFNKEL
ncbi:hypothetical protein H7097_04600 [Aeromicrobium sp.]|nr:hypothetical protein [Candidatus Saccharibacteria bacterium]